MIIKYVVYLIKFCFVLLEMWGLKVNILIKKKKLNVFFFIILYVLNDNIGIFWIYINLLDF